MMCITRTSEVSVWPRAEEQVCNLTRKTSWENFCYLKYIFIELKICSPVLQTGAGVTNGGGAGAAGGKEV